MDHVEEFVWKVGGAQGEGIESTGEIFALTFHRLGYYVHAYRHFMSLIKGGHTHYHIRVSTQLRRHHGDGVDLMIAFDPYSIEYNLATMRPGGVIVYDARFEPQVPADAPVRLLGVPMTEMARESGNAIMKNMAAVGVTAALMGVDAEAFRPFLAERFGAKGQKVVDANMAILHRGFEFTAQHFGQLFQLPPPPAAGLRRPFMTGNDALALGALAAGCRLVFQYPITPATDVMYWMLKNLPKFGGAVVQAEDEIAAINAVIGANYAGVRAMTATSGPGFSLMQEGLGLAGITETPAVVVDVQRGGPSTGLPTKTEQSDVLEMCFGSHGEFPRIVLSPATVEESFRFGVEAFNLAERFQCPVIIASDMFLATSRQTIDGLDYEAVRIDRGALLSDEELQSLPPGSYRRYRITESGISPRAVPGQPNGMFRALSNEHDEGLEEIEDPEMRRLQMEKRFRKLDAFDRWDLALTYEGPEEPDLLLVGFCSTYGAIREACAQLAAEGHHVAHLHLRLLAPFPKDQVRPHVARAGRVLVVEHNLTGQLRKLLEMHVGFHDKYESCLKFDGNPFAVGEITARARDVLGVGAPAR